MFCDTILPVSDVVIIRNLEQVKKEIQALLLSNLVYLPGKIAKFLLLLKLFYELRK